jgi:hypothetical protein
MCCALFIAEKTKSTLVYPSHPSIKNQLFDFRSPGQTNCERTVKDQFFGHTMLKELLPEYTEMAQIEISQKYILGLLDLPKDNEWTIMSPKEDFDSTLVIHMRSGDIMKVGTNKNYPQPPLAAYKKAILNNKYKFSHILIITEKDLVNPCIKGLKSYCDESGISCFIQTTSQKNDAATIVKARYIVTSQSSFVWSLMRCNSNLKVAFIPNIRFPKSSIFPESIPKLPYEQHYYGLPDYICAKEWTYSPGQLRLMLSYPTEMIPEIIV